MATCTMAKVRSLGLLPTSLATRALVVAFQSVTTSAHAGATHSAAATMLGSRTGIGFLGIALMASSLYGRASNAELRRSRALMSKLGCGQRKETSGEETPISRLRTGVRRDCSARAANA